MQNRNPMNTEQRDTPTAAWIENPYACYLVGATSQTPERNAAGIAYPSIEEQKTYWQDIGKKAYDLVMEARDIGGNILPDRIEANQDRYFS